MNMKNRSNETLSYMIYMANRWGKDEAISIFGEMLGSHIWAKYMSYANNYSMYDAYSRLVFELDTDNLNLLLERATSIYDGRKFRK